MPGIPCKDLVAGEVTSSPRAQGPTASYQVSSAGWVVGTRWLGGGRRLPRHGGLPGGTASATRMRLATALAGRARRVPGTHLEVGVIAVGVPGLPDLHVRPGLLHELAGGQGHGAQHAASAALEHLPQDLAGREAGASEPRAGGRTSRGPSKGAGFPRPPPDPKPTPPATSHRGGAGTPPPQSFLKTPLLGALRKPPEPIRGGPGP